MISTTQVLLLLTAAAGTLAVPTKSVFSVTQVKNPNWSGKAKNGYLEAHKSYKKYGKTIPSGLAQKVQQIKTENKAKRDGTGSAGTDSQSDEMWLTPVNIGGQDITLDFDTGSSDLWITQDAWQKAGSDSAGQLMDGETWTITYGDGSKANGIVYQGSVGIGGFSVPQQAIEVAQSSSDGFGNGLLGLGMSSINTVTPDQQKTWIDNACGSLTACLFTADLGSGSNPGKYNFGYVDKSYGSINYVTSDPSQGWYQFDIEGYGSSANVIADTGTTLVMVPDEMADAYWSNNGGTAGQGVYQVADCSQVADFEFTIGGQKTVIPAQYMCLDDGQNGQIGAVTGGCGGDGNPCILGDAWLKAVYAVFDLQGNRFGWSQKVQGGSSSSSSSSSSGHKHHHGGN